MRIFKSRVLYKLPGYHFRLELSLSFQSYNVFYLSENLNTLHIFKYSKINKLSRSNYSLSTEPLTSDVTPELEKQSAV